MTSHKQHNMLKSMCGAGIDASTSYIMNGEISSMIKKREYRFLWGVQSWMKAVYPSYKRPPSGANIRDIK